MMDRILTRLDLALTDLMPKSFSPSLSWVTPRILVILLVAGYDVKPESCLLRLSGPLFDSLVLVIFDLFL